MPPQPNAERRVFSRKDSTIGVNIKAINGLILTHKYADEMGHNIGSGGICLEMTKPLQIGDEVVLQVLLSETGKLFSVAGQVVWVDSFLRNETVIDNENIPARNNYKAGIEFCDISSAVLTTINKFASEND